MTEAPDLVPQPAPEAQPPKPRSPIRRAGCILALIIWFAILLLPCFLIVLATQEEITITTGDVPGQQTRLWLISEAEERGIALSTGSVFPTSDTAVCIQTDVNYFLWTGSEQPSTYCECYERASADASWSYLDSTQGACSTR